MLGRLPWRRGLSVAEIEDRPAELAGAGRPAEQDLTRVLAHAATERLRTPERMFGAVGLSNGYFFDRHSCSARRMWISASGVMRQFWQVLLPRPLTRRDSHARFRLMRVWSLVHCMAFRIMGVYGGRWRS